VSTDVQYAHFDVDVMLLTAIKQDVAEGSEPTYVAAINDDIGKLQYSSGSKGQLDV
jgi:hypothetical protein